MTVSALIAGVCWVIGVGLVIADWFDVARQDSGEVGIVLVALGHLVTTKAEICRQATRERSAYELGRESVRSIR